MKISQRIFSEKCVEWDGSVGQPPMEWGGWSCKTTRVTTVTPATLSNKQKISLPVTNTFFHQKNIPCALVEILKVTYEMSII